MQVINFVDTLTCYLNNSLIIRYKQIFLVLNTYVTRFKMKAILKVLVFAALTVFNFQCKNAGDNSKETFLSLGIGLAAPTLDELGYHVAGGGTLPENTRKLDALSYGLGIQALMVKTSNTVLRSVPFVSLGTMLPWIAWMSVQGFPIIPTKNPVSVSCCSHNTPSQVSFLSRADSGRT